MISTTKSEGDIGTNDPQHTFGNGMSRRAPNDLYVLLQEVFFLNSRTRSQDRRRGKRNPKQDARSDPTEAIE